MAVKQLLSRHSDWEAWPIVDESVLSDDEKYRYVKVHDAIVDVCSGCTPKAIENKYGISKSLMAYYLSRCLQLHSDGKIVGFRALVDYSFRTGYVRVAATNAEHSRAGLSGAFEKLLDDYSAVRKWLLERLKGKYKASLGIKLSLLHQEFLTELRKSGCQSDCYPFNTSRRGYESFCTWVKKYSSLESQILRKNFLAMRSIKEKGEINDLLF